MVETHVSYRFHTSDSSSMQLITQFHLPDVHIQSLLSIFTFPLFHQPQQELGRLLSLRKSSKTIELQPTERNDETEAHSQLSDRRKSVEGVTTLPVKNADAALTSSNLTGQFSATWNDFKRQIALAVKPRYRRSVILGIGVPVICQLVGMNVLSSYTTTIFEDSGVDQAIVGSSVVGLAFIVGSVIAIAIYDRYKRKNLAYISFSGMALSYLGVALSSLAKSSVSGPLSVIFIIKFSLSCTLACGTLSVAYAPEVVPSEIASLVLGIGQSAGLFVTFLLVLLFPSVLDAIGALLCFLIFFSFCVFSLIFLKFYMIETKGRELADIMAEVIKS